MSALAVNKTPGPARMHRPPVLLPHLGGRGGSVEGALPDASCSCFAAAVRWLQKTGNGGRQTIRNNQGAAAKREAEGIRKYPQLSQLPYVVEWAKALESPPGQAPVTGAASVPDEVRNAAAKPFSLTPSKGAFSFSSERGTPQKPSEAGFVGKRKAAKRRQRRKKRAGFEEAARLADPKGPEIAMPRRCARGQRSGIRDALPRRASRI